MGSLGDRDADIQPMEDKRNENFTLNDTQLFDSQNISPEIGDKGGNDNEFQLLQGNALFDDTVLVKDAFETQVVDLGDETQMLDYPDCETQLIEEFNSDGEGTDKTEVLDDNDGLSDNDSHRRSKSESLDVEMTGDTSLEHSMDKIMQEHNENCCSGLNVSSETPTSKVSKQPRPGSVQRFTSIRAASLRASGQAARKNALDKTNSSSCSLFTDSQHSEKQANKTNESNTEVLEDVDQVCDAGRDNDGAKGSINGKTTSFCHSTVTKLFVGDCFAENEIISYGDKNVGEKEMLQLPTCDDGLAGLSYIDSQEPGELSQANALACVQRLIEENRLLFDNESHLGNRSKGKSNFVSTAKGPQSLARKTKDRGKYVKSTIFDWDDGREDEGGGEIFHRRKKEFFGESSDSKMVVRSSNLNNKRMSESEMNVTNDIVSEFNEESNGATSAGQLKAAEVLNVGLDTQMAAEAMEALFNGDGIANSAANDVPGNSEGNSKKGSTGTKARKKSSQQKRHSFNEDGDIGFAARQSKKKRIRAKSSKQPPESSQKQSENVISKCDMNGVMTRRKRTKTDAEVLMIHRMKTVGKMPTVDGHQGTALTRSCLVRKRSLTEDLAPDTSIAYRTRQASVVSQLGRAENVQRGCRKAINCLVDVNTCKKSKADSGVEDAKGKYPDLFSIKSKELENFKSKSITMSNGFSCPKRRRSCQRLSGQLNLDAQSKPSTQLENIGKSVSTCKRSQSNAKISNVCPDSSSVCTTSRGELSPQTIDKTGSSNENRKEISHDQMGMKDLKLNDRNNSSPSALDEIKLSSVNVPKEAAEPSISACTSPVDLMTPVNVASPVCVGNGYLKQSCKRSLSRSFMMREIGSLSATWHEPVSVPKDLRKRRDLANVKVLFSQHLDDDILKQQRKIADRLKVTTVSSITDATHFITDMFVRTRNMLEAIASGKTVVTHLWLENIGRAKYYIDEQKYILRDAKKEKELGFNMEVSLALACQRPLLQGRRVLITPNAKPSKEIISGLVKTAGGQALERVGRSALKDETIPDDLLILSCEEDYEICVPFLEKGAAVYGSELLLNGIVTQKLEYERHQLFADHVKRTRSTIWLKRGGDNFVPVTKHK